MRKKALSWLLSVSMVLTMFVSAPLTAVAVTYTAGNAVGFDSSSNSYITVPDSNSLDVTNALTFEAWIKPSAGGGEWALIAGKQLNPADANPWYSYRLLAASANSGEKGFPRKVAFQIAPEGSGETGVESSTVVQNDIWTHVAGVYDGTSVKIYINGVLENLNPVTGDIQVSDLPLYIGKAPWTNYNNYNGLIDEVRVWNVARTAEQIGYDMQYTLTGSEPGLVSYWRFDDSFGITTADATGNNNDGNLYNSAYFTASGAPVASPYDGEYNIEAGPVTISADGDYRIYGTGVSTTNTIVINTGVTAHIVLDDININVSGTSDACAFDIQGTAQVDAFLAQGSENTLRSGENKAGLQVADAAQLTIDTDVDDEGIINSYGGNYGAAIGGAYQHSGGIIIIDNGIINANASYGAGAGIGSGLYGDDCDITINGGIITANGSGAGAGIGSGGSGDVGRIYIHGGTVVASSTGNEAGYDGGSGIGSGDEGYNGEILIDGGTVTASGKYDCPGIGGCYGSTGTITIRGAGTTVTASSGLYAAGIGGGYGDGGGVINIEGGTVTANGRYNSPGIGDYDDGTTVINISGGTVISNGGEEACGIGSGYHSEYNPLPILNLTGGSLSVSHGAGESFDINAVLKTTEGEAFSTGGRIVPASGQIISVAGPVTGVFAYDLNGISANETVITAAELSTTGYFVLYPLETGMQIIRQSDAFSWKYADDTVQPVLSSGTADRTSDSEADITFTCNEFAGFFYEVTADGATMPDIDTSGSGDYCNGETTLHLDSLTAGACDIYLQAKDMAGNEGPIIKIDIDAFSGYVCKIGDTQYTSLADALDNLTSGQTIELLSDITYNERIWAGSSYCPSLSLDLNGYELNISNVEVPIGALDGYDIIVTDSSESGGGTLILNTTSDDSAPTGVTAVGIGSSVFVDSSVTTTITATGGNSKGVSTYYGGSVEIGSGVITSDTYGIYSYGVSGDTASLVTFTGDVSALSDYGIGVYTESGGSAAVTGDVSGPYIGHGAIAYEGSIMVTGDIFSSGIAATARGSGIVTVTGNITSTGEYGRGAFAYNGGTVNISGNVTASGSNEYGAYADNGSCITVGGNVSQTGGSGVGAYAAGYIDGSEITIDGSIDAVTFVQVGGENKEPDDNTEPTTKAGYFTYSYGDPVSTVWVKTVYSTDATLSDLSATNVTLSPSFGSNVTSYSASVANSISSTTVAVQQSDSKATVKINGTDAVSKVISLSEGSNVITVLVTAEDGTTTKTYTITITRSSAGGGGDGGSPTPVGQQVTVSTPDGTTGVTGTLTESENKEQVTIGGTQFGTLVDADQGAVIPVPFATVTFDQKAVNTINGASSTGDVVLTVEKLDPSTLTPEQQKRVGDHPVYDFTLTKGGRQISSFGGGHAEISIPYTLKPGENPNLVVIYYLADDGSLKTVRGHYDPETKCVVFKTTHFSKYAVGYNPVSFNDVASDAWYKNAVDFIAARGITSGTGNGAYSPNLELTRGQFIVLLMNAYEISTDSVQAGTANFADAGNTYYTNYLLAAKGLGIVNGIGNNLFAPEQTITRQEMFVMLYNALKVLGELPAVAGTKQLSDFGDANMIAAWAQEAVSALVKGGVVAGNEGMLNPTTSTTRSEIAQMLYNLLSK